MVPEQAVLPINRLRGLSVTPLLTYPLLHDYPIQIPGKKDLQKSVSVRKFLGNPFISKMIADNTTSTLIRQEIMMARKIEYSKRGFWPLNESLFGTFFPLKPIKHAPWQRSYKSDDGVPFTKVQTDRFKRIVFENWGPPSTTFLLGHDQMSTDYSSKDFVVHETKWTFPDEPGELDFAVKAEISHNVLELQEVPEVPDKSDTLYWDNEKLIMAGIADLDESFEGRAADARFAADENALNIELEAEYDDKMSALEAENQEFKILAAAFVAFVSDPAPINPPRPPLFALQPQTWRVFTCSHCHVKGHTRVSCKDYKESRYRPE